jgi:hypothetical protein
MAFIKALMEALINVSIKALIKGVSGVDYGM